MGTSLCTSPNNPPRHQALAFLPKQSGPRDGSCHPHLKAPAIATLLHHFPGENLEVNQEELLATEEAEGHKKSVVSLNSEGDNEKPFLSTKKQ